jgi:hypothetical protein
MFTEGVLKEILGLTGFATRVGGTEIRKKQ